MDDSENAKEIFNETPLGFSKDFVHNLENTNPNLSNAYVHKLEDTNTETNSFQCLKTVNYQQNEFDARKNSKDSYENLNDEYKIESNTKVDKS